MLIAGIITEDMCAIVVGGCEPPIEEDLYDEDDLYEDYEPDYDECGYNPYMGCYDFDC